MKKFRLLRNPSSWRRTSLATWKAPNDPTVYGALLLDFSRAQEFLKQLNERSPVKVTPTHLVGKALALTLRRFPDLNGIVRWRRIYLRESVDIFFQVAIPAAAGEERPDLSGAKIAACDGKNLEQIAAELKEKSGRIRQGEDPQFRSSLVLLKLIPGMLLPGFLRFLSFLIYNLGWHSAALGVPEDPFGSAMVTSVGSLKAPAGFAPLVPFSRVPLIVCVGQVRPGPWVVEGQVVARPLLDLGITFDHRFIDGLRASQMEKYFTEILENPERLQAASL